MSSKSSQIKQSKLSLLRGAPLLLAIIISTGLVGNQILTSKAAAPQSGPGHQLAAEEQDFVAALNAHRAALGLPAMSETACLNSSAASWSKYLADTFDFTPGSLVHGDAAGRIHSACGNSSPTGEAIYYQGWPMSGQDSLNLWLSDAPHKALMESPSLNRVGISMFSQNYTGYFQGVTFGVADFESGSGSSSPGSSVKSTPSSSASRSSVKVAPEPPPPPPPPPPPAAPTIQSAAVGHTKVDAAKSITIGYSIPVTLTGITVPNGSVTLTIHSAVKTTTVTADGFGLWTYTIRGLDPGMHYVEATVTDPTTKLTSSSAKLFTFKVGATPKPAILITTPNRPLAKTTAELFILLTALMGVLYFGLIWEKKKTLGQPLKLSLIDKLLAIVFILAIALPGALLLSKSFEDTNTAEIGSSGWNLSLDSFSQQPAIVRVAIIGTVVTALLLGLLYMASLLNLKFAKRLLSLTLRI